LLAGRALCPSRPPNSDRANAQGFFSRPCASQAKDYGEELIVFKLAYPELADIIIRAKNVMT